METFIEANPKIMAQKNQNRRNTIFTIKRNTRKNNLTIEERRALNKLKASGDIVVSNVDKGGAVVIQDIKNYTQEEVEQ